MEETSSGIMNNTWLSNLKTKESSMEEISSVFMNNTWLSKSQEATVEDEVDLSTLKTKGSSMEEISLAINNILQGVDMDDNAKSLLSKSLEATIKDKVDLSTLKTKLEILYNYEKNYLELVKEFKEEIKFASSIQENLRKERAKFFAETLKEVQSTLKDSQVDSEVALGWVKELVNSYTKSLDLSGGLIEEHTLDMIGKIRKKAKQEVKKSELK